jgi:hypothetical protein
MEQSSFISIHPVWRRMTPYKNAYYIEKKICFLLHEEGPTKFKKTTRMTIAIIIIIEFRKTDKCTIPGEKKK